MGELKVEDKFLISSLGVVKRQDESASIKIYEQYGKALLGLDQFSHIIVFYWLHENDTSKIRDTLQVHPRKDVTRPLTGVFATRSPARPNLIAVCVCKILSVRENTIKIDRIDALDGSPVIDIKPYIPRTDSISDGMVPKWVEK